MAPKRPRDSQSISAPSPSQALYKSADVAQMLIVHRENEVPGAERCRDCWSKGYDGDDFPKENPGLENGTRFYLHSGGSWTIT